MKRRQPGGLLRIIVERYAWNDMPCLLAASPYSVLMRSTDNRKLNDCQMISHLSKSELLKFLQIRAKPHGKTVVQKSVKYDIRYI